MKFWQRWLQLRARLSNGHPTVEQPPGYEVSQPSRPNNRLTLALLGVVAVVVWTGLLLWSVKERSYQRIAILTLILVVAVVVLAGQRIIMSRLALIEQARGHTEWPRRFGPYMLRNKGRIVEKVLWEGRKHYALVLPWLLLLVLALAGAIAAGVVSGNWLVFLGIWILPSVFALTRIYAWRLGWVVISEQRLLFIEGFFVTRVPNLRRNAIARCDIVETAIGKLLGYVHYHIDTPLEEAPHLKWLAFMPRDAPVQELLLHLREPDTIGDDAA